MARHTGPILVDTMVILECHGIGAWRALAGGYGVQTVEDCVTETQTGFQRRRHEQQIEAAALRASLAGVYAVDDAQRAAILVQTLDLAVDEGELSLWAHAAARSDGWILCGPDKSSLRLGVRLSFRDGSSRWRNFSPMSATGRRPRSSTTTRATGFSNRW
jgi:hypothetical protein